MDTSRFDQLVNLIFDNCEEESYHDYQTGVHGQWMDDPNKDRFYKLLIDAETGEVDTVQRVGTARTFYRQDHN